jgi:hypothetical protein
MWQFADLGISLFFKTDHNILLDVPEPKDLQMASPGPTGGEGWTDQIFPIGKITL